MNLKIISRSYKGHIFILVVTDLGTNVMVTVQGQKRQEML